MSGDIKIELDKVGSALKKTEERIDIVEAKLTLAEGKDAEAVARFSTELVQLRDKEKALLDKEKALLDKEKALLDKGNLRLALELEDKKRGYLLCVAHAVYSPCPFRCCSLRHSCPFIHLHLLDWFVPSPTQHPRSA